MKKVFKLDIHTIRRNCNTFDKAVKEFKPLQDYINGKIRINQLEPYGLTDFGYFHLRFKKFINDDSLYPILRGDVEITFEELKDKILHRANLTIRNGKINNYINRKIPHLCRILPEMIEEEFAERMLGSKHSNGLFEWLGHDCDHKNIYKKLYIYVNNYMGHKLLDISEDIFEQIHGSLIYFYTTPLEYPEFNKLKKDKVNTDEIIEKMIGAIHDTTSIDWVYLKKELNKRLDKLDKQEFERSHNRNRIIDEII